MSDRFVDERRVRRQTIFRRKVELADCETTAEITAVVVDVGLPVAMSEERALLLGLGEDRLVRHTEHGIEIGVDGDAHLMVGRSPDLLLFLLTLLGSTRQIVQVRRVERGRHVREPELFDLGVGLGLDPWAKEPRRIVVGLPAQGLGIPSERFGGRRAPKDPESELGGFHLEAPCVWGLRPEAVITHLVVIDQHAVAPGREKPGNRKIRRIGPPSRPPRREDLAHDPVLSVVVVRPVGNVMLEGPAGLVDGVAALAEADEALA